MSGNPTTPNWSYDAKNEVLSLSTRTWVEDVLYIPWVAGTYYPWNFFGVIYSVSSQQAIYDAGQPVGIYGQAVKEANTSQTNLWASCFSLVDNSGIGLAGTQEARIGMEIDVNGNGPTNGGNRAGIVIALTKSAASSEPVEFTTGIAINCPSSPLEGVVDKPFIIGGNVSTAAIDLTYVTLTPGGKNSIIHLPDNGPVSLSTDGAATIYWSSSQEKFIISYAGIQLFSVDTKGNIRARGSITPDVFP